MRNQAALSHLGDHHAPDHLPQVAVTFFEIGVLIVHEDCGPEVWFWEAEDQLMSHGGLNESYEHDIAHLTRLT